MKRRRIFAVALALLLTMVGAAFASSTWQVVRKVRLLTSPGGQKIKTLHPPALLTAVGGQSGDYIRVRDEGENVGWVYEAYLTEVPEEQPTEPVAGVANAIDPTWDKPAPQASTFYFNGQSCGPTGTPGSETETNRRKNRTDVPASYHAVTFEAVDQLPWPTNASTQRSSWTAAQLAAIAPYEGVALTVTGYLVALKPQKNSAEACNCGWTGDDVTDWHMALAGHQGDKEADAIVVETTPRIRKNHPLWTPTNLAPWVNSPNQIRVSGWLMMDPQHKAHLHPTATSPAFRNTLWEIHPITKIEVMQNGSWVDCDVLHAGPT